MINKIEVFSQRVCALCQGQLEPTTYNNLSSFCSSIHQMECLGGGVKCREIDSFFGIDLAFIQAFSYLIDPFLISAVTDFEEVRD